MSDLHGILHDYWGYTSFRPLQEEIIRAVLKREDCLALLPTGGGKSLCFQVPAMAQPGLCLVISPLIALMKDQVESLRRKNITAFSIHSGLTRREVISTLTLAGRSNCKFLYVSPERLETNLFKEYLHSLGICLIAVDEAHCISQWGYDFRPSYLKIAALREELPGVPVLALTASATAEVQKDICDKLLFAQPSIFRQSFARPNLSYSAFDTDSRINRITDILQKVAGASIVYCRSRRQTRELSDMLNLQGLGADFYHAGLPTETRSAKQEAWLKNQTRVIVCTNAFGMGIDKPDVRTVIHAGLPDCLENYYQEAGRAGRDGKRSYAVLLYNKEDLRQLAASPSLRFPPLDRIRKIYQALMNHLQIAAGSGGENDYELDINHFIRQFDLKAAETLPALKTLEQEGLLYFSEQVFVPSSVQVVAARQELQAFEAYHSKLEPLLKAMLRQYAGIVDQPAQIYERALAATLRISADEVHRQLMELQAHGIISYTPKKEKPQVYLPMNRVRADDLQIDIPRYQKRKIQYEERIGAMMQFVHSDLCRSRFIGNYFGDAALEDCGICDVCLQRKKRNLSAKEFDDIHEQIVALLVPAPLPVKEIMRQTGQLSKEKIMEAIEFLQTENKVFMRDDGSVALVYT